MDGIYVPISIRSYNDDESFRGWSDSLGLYLCWEDGKLRFWDPESESYPENFAEKSARADGKNPDPPEM